MNRKTSLKAIRTMFLVACLSGAMLATVMAGTAGPEDGGEFWQLQNLSDPVIRLHVVANSNLPRDQHFKAQTVTQVLRFLAGYHFGSTEAQRLSSLREMLPELLNHLAQYAAGEGLSEMIFTAALVRDHFPLRAYGRKIYPAGEYQALKVMIGAGEGENWWCLLFPPLCLPMVEIDPSAQDGDQADHVEPGTLNGGPGPVDSENRQLEKREGRWKLKVWEQLNRWFGNN